VAVRVIGRRDVYRKVNIVDTMFKMLEKYSTDLEEIVRVRTIALEEERKKTENLLSQMLPAYVASTISFTFVALWTENLSCFFRDDLHRHGSTSTMCSQALSK